VVPASRCAFDGIIVAARGGKTGKFGNLDILFGTGQFRHQWHQRWQRIRVPSSSTGSNLAASWQRLRLFRDGPGESALISVTVSGSATTYCVLFSQLCDERSESSKLALRSECGFGRVPPARAVTFSSVSSFFSGLGSSLGFRGEA
jgi:hypothetical protein